MADVAATLAGWSSTTSSNAPAGGATIGTGLDDNLREIQGVIVRGLSHKGADIASSATTDIGAVEGLMHDITGTTTITGLGTVRAGILKILQFDGALTLTHNATSLVLPGGANITTAAGDVATFLSEGSGNWRCVSYVAAAGGVVGTTQTLTHKGLVDVSAAAAGQIKFPVTQNASSDANTLDDYEEGTWTPSPSYASGSASTITVTSARYTKVGRLVSINFDLSFRVGTGSGVFKVTGLPFTAGAAAGASISYLNLVTLASGVVMYASVVTSTTEIQFYTKAHDGTASAMASATATQFASSGSDMRIILGATYSV